MHEADAPPALVTWPAPGVKTNRLCVLISDIHCTDCSVGNQTASENDWQLFFEQLLFAVCNPPSEKSEADPDQIVDELLLVLNGDIVDLIRSSKWAEAGVYPWQRDDPRFERIAMDIMRQIVAIHARKRLQGSEQPYSGFFYWMRKTMMSLQATGVKVTVIPIVGNHDKELQVLPAVRKMFYEECLGLRAADIEPAYRDWVAAQLGTSPDDAYPCLPFYFADAQLRLLATHGQWRDPDNARSTPRWQPRDGWSPQAWRREQYRAFSDPCFGDTVAAGMLSHFIWCTAKNIRDDMAGARRIRNLLDEMDLYRPSVSAVIRLLRESRRMARKDPAAKGLHDQVLECFRQSLIAWLSHRETWNSTSGMMKLGLWLLFFLGRLRWYWLDIALMRVMAKRQEPEDHIATADVMRLPAFRPEYRELGLRLHVEGHTHVALDADVQFPKPHSGRNNYSYINLGAWRDCIAPKRNTGYRRRGIGRALFIFDLAKLAGKTPDDAYRYYARDMTSWGDRLDSW